MKKKIINSPRAVRFVFGVSLFTFLLLLASCNSTASLSNQKKEKQKEDIPNRVRIKRTAFGVPHIKAEDLKAAGFALGYVQMEDYGDRLVKGLIRNRGEWLKYHEVPLAEREKSIDNAVVNRIKYNKAVETYSLLEQDTKDVIEGFAAGVNAYIEKYGDQFEDWVKPEFTPYDVHAAEINHIPLGSVHAFLNAIKESESDKKLASSTGESSLWTRLAADYKEPHPDIGSNSWAFAPDRTSSGKSILVRNPHLNWDAGYYEVHLEVPGKFNFYGDFRIGAPLITIGGFNQYLGFSTTNNNSFMDEIYALDADPTKADHYILDDISRPIERENISIEFKNGNARGTVSREILKTEFGPVIHRGNGKIYILKSAAEEAFLGGEQYLKMMQAKNLEEWKTAMRIRGIITSNFTYADVHGSIFYVWNGAVPDLPLKWSENKKEATPVKKRDEIWSSLIPWDDLPQLENPRGGYLHNENDPFHFTNLNEILPPEDFPDYFPQPKFDLRSQLSHEIIADESKKFSLEEIVELKNTETMLLAHRVKEDLIAAVRNSETDRETTAAINLLEDWNNTVSRESKGSVLFKTWWYRYVETAPSNPVRSSPESAGFSAQPDELFKTVWSSDDPVNTPYGLADKKRAQEAFEWAVQEVKEKYGTWEVTWGEVHRAVAKNKNIPISGCSGVLGCFKVLWYKDAEEAGKPIQEVTGGDGWVIAVEFGERPKAYSILAYGQSADENSPYYYDQLQLFADKKMKPVYFTEEEINREVLKEYRPGKEE